MKLTQAVLLVGGKGTRIKSVSRKVPKPLIKINGVPFLKYLIDELIFSGIKKFVLIVGPNKIFFIDFIKKYYPNFYFVLVADKKQIGTGNALFESRLFLEKYFLLLNGDSFIKFNYKKILIFFQNLRVKKPFFIVNNVNNTSRYGKLIIHNNKIKKIIEKRNNFPGFINSGIYVLNKYYVLDILHSNTKSLEKEFFPKLIKKYETTILKTKCEFIDIGTINSLNYSSLYFKK